MSGSKTAYLSQKMLDHVLGGATYSQPANLWLVLSDQPFTPAATGTACDELLAGDYARLEVTNDSSTWGAATAGAPSTKSNLDDMAWDPATSDWGTPLSVYLADAATDGNLLYGADLGDTSDVASGDTFKILAGTFSFSED